tara:strand:+ start:178 stop:1020 length:843 start_codon:yes stop_codon:yes gene_type:complete
VEIVKNIAPIALAFIMLALGLGLKGQDFLRVFIKPKDFLVGIICQLVLLPIIAFILIKLFNTSLEIALGVMIIASAPGGVTSNILTKLAKGDVALSISLTAIVSLISMLSVPFIIFTSAYLLQASNISKEISMFSMSIKMFMIVALPVLIGMLLGKFIKNYTIRKLMETISVVLFLIMVFGAIWEEGENIIFNMTQAGTITLALNIIMMIVGYYVAKFLATGIAQRKCISLECGLQNGTLAVFVTTQLFNDVTFLIPIATYSLIMFLTSIIFIFIVRNIN